MGCDDVSTDADVDCRICSGNGWHWGWDAERNPVQLRCPCVDKYRDDIAALATTIKWRSRRGRYRTDYCNRMALAVQRGGTLAEVAKEFGVSNVAVFNACKRRGVKSRLARK